MRVQFTALAALILLPSCATINIQRDAENKGGLLTAIFDPNAGLSEYEICEKGERRKVREINFAALSRLFGLGDSTEPPSSATEDPEPVVDLFDEQGRPIACLGLEGDPELEAPESKQSLPQPRPQS